MKPVVGGGPGEPAGRVLRRFLPDTEVIGPPDCPILHRWTLASVLGRKLLLHHFQPNADDRAEHDHPSPFWTLVLRGYYDDIAHVANGSVRERMAAGMLRRRAAEHRHVTKVGPDGCWTLVFMGKKTRPWGFWEGNRWYFWRDHEQRFGFGMRCAEDPEPEPTCMSCGGNDGYGPPPHHAPDCYFASAEDAAA
jgi:hypothetical protein